MRLWSIHPSYLDSAGLCALWRESLLAKSVLQGKTKGYRKHPQLERFRQHSSPVAAINAYLSHVCAESCSRGYCFDKRKIGKKISKKKIPVSKAQLLFEFSHLKRKLRKRNPRKYRLLLKVKSPEAHSLFEATEGKIEKWEKTAQRFI